MDWPSIPDFIMNDPEEARLRVLELLKEFVCVSVSNVPELQTHREPFTPAPQYQRVMDCLAEAGYAERIGFVFRWTDKIAPIMQRLGEWDEVGNHFETMMQNQDWQLAHEAWDTMPATIKERLKKNPDDLLTIRGVLSCFWINQRWEQPDPERVELGVFYYSMDVARIISSKLKALEETG